MVANLLLLIGVILVLGEVIGKITHNLKLTGVVGYILAGVILGPLTKAFNYFGVEGETVTAIWEVATKITLAFVAFIIGAHLTFRLFKKLGKPIIAAIFGESFGAFFLVFIASYFVSGDLTLSLLLASLAPASAPAGTVAALHEYGARGPLTDAILAVVGWDDALAILIFAGALSVVKIILGGELAISSLVEPLSEIGGAILLGFAIGGILFFLMKRIKERETLFVASIASIFVGAGLAELSGVSLILTCMVIGMVLINSMPTLGRTSLNMVENLMPPVYVIFFALAGTQLRLDLLPTMGLLGFVYVIGRSLGLIGGAHLSTRISGAPKVIQRYLGFGILCQAGVAIGLAALACSELASHPIGAELAQSALTLIMATTVVFEIIGPVGVRYAITRAGEARYE